MKKIEWSREAIQAAWKAFNVASMNPMENALNAGAADEITRLKAIASKAIREQIPMREEIDALKAQLEPFRMFESAEAIHALRAENARLTTDKERLQGAAVAFTKGNATLHAEIVALRAELGILKGDMPARAASLKLAEQHTELEALRAENAKLREALKPFAEYEFDDMDEDEDETASPFILMKHLRAARAAMGEKKE